MEAYDVQVSAKACVIHRALMLTTTIDKQMRMSTTSRYSEERDSQVLSDSRNLKLQCIIPSAVGYRKS